MQQLLKSAIRTRSRTAGADTFHVSRGSIHLVGLSYGSTAYVFFHLVEKVPLTADLKSELATLVRLAFLAHQNRSARSALRAQEKPIDVSAAGAKQFYELIAQFLSDATGMQLIALRERGAPGTSFEHNLYCTVIKGWGDLPKEDFDLMGFEDYEPFRRAVFNAEPTFSPDRHRPDLQLLWRRNSHLTAVQSFAVFPIMDGERVRAVLSVASKCRFDFTPTFKSVMAGIARAVGYALRNRDLYFEKNELQSSTIEATVALNAVELISDLTHQIRNTLTEIPESLELLALKLKSKEVAADSVDRSREYVDLESAADRVSDLLRQADDIIEPPDLELEDVSVAKVWRDAVDIVHYRLEKRGIEAKCHGDVRLSAYPVLLRQVFFHLLLNSIAAYTSRPARRNRLVELRIAKPTRGSGMVLLRYVDFAGGINPANLRRRGDPASNKLPPPEEAIFLRGVTSNPAGTGHGMWIVRQLLQRHRGGIELKQYRDGGVVFDITMPSDLRSLVARRKVM